jgi:DNA end-binding protein Ku
MAERFRTSWKGFLRLSLVTIPVKMVTATRTANEISFHQIDRKTNQRIRYSKVVPGKGEVAKEDIVRGYEFEPGRYVLLDDEELDAVKLESKHTIELTQFVDACEIDPLYFEKPYYLLPDGDVAEEGYRVIRDALREMGKVGIGQQSIRGRENLVTIHPAGNGLLMETLRYEEEVKEADEVFADIARGKLRGDLIDMAKDLIGRKAEPFDPGRFENHYAEALRDLVRRKVETGRSVAVDEDEGEKPGTVVDFMEALRRSLSKEPAGAGPSPAAEAEREAAPPVRGRKETGKTAEAPTKSARGGSKAAASDTAKATPPKAPAKSAASNPARGKAEGEPAKRRKAG